MGLGLLDLEYKEGDWLAGNDSYIYEVLFKYNHEDWGWGYKLTRVDLEYYPKPAPGSRYFSSFYVSAQSARLHHRFIAVSRSRVFKNVMML